MPHPPPTEVAWPALIPGGMSAAPPGSPLLCVCVEEGRSMRDMQLLIVKQYMSYIH